MVLHFVARSTSKPPPRFSAVALLAMHRARLSPAVHAALITPLSARLVFIWRIRGLMLASLGFSRLRSSFSSRSCTTAARSTACYLGGCHLSSSTFARSRIAASLAKPPGAASRSKIFAILHSCSSLLPICVPPRSPSSLHRRAHTSWRLGLDSRTAPLLPPAPIPPAPVSLRHFDSELHGLLQTLWPARQVSLRLD